MKIGAAIFDVFGTLVDWRKGVSEGVAPILMEKGIDIAPTVFADAWRGQYQPAMERIRSGGRGYIPLDDLHLENLGFVLDDFGIADRFSAEDRASMNTVWERLPPWPDTVAGLELLKRQMIIAPCSNGSIALMTRLARFGGLPWDCILGADIARNYKPHPDAYLASAAALRLPPSRVLMVAAHNDDLAKAAEAGLRTAFIPRVDESGPSTGDAAPGGDVTFAAPDLADLAAQLRR